MADKKPEKPKNDFLTAMRGHGVTKGKNDHKRHPATNHYKGSTVDQARYGRK